METKKVTGIITSKMANISKNQINVFIQKRAVNFSIIVILIWASVCISSCSSNDIFEPQVVNDIHIDSVNHYVGNSINFHYADTSDIPFASDEELAPYIDYACYEEDGVLSYLFARDYAFAEFYANVNLYYPDENLFVTDNGYMTGDHHNYPYWSVLGGLNYAWELN